MIDVKKIQDEAQAEVDAEKQKAAKVKIKELLIKKEKAQQVVTNVEREIADALASIGDGNN